MQHVYFIIIISNSLLLLLLPYVISIGGVVWPGYRGKFVRSRLVHVLHRLIVWYQYSPSHATAAHFQSHTVGRIFILFIYLKTI